MKHTLFVAAAMMLSAASGWALTPSQLTPSEKATYASLKNQPDEAAAFLATRDYVRLCQKVVNKSMPAIRLTDIPDNYSDKYVSPAEASAVDKATSLRFAAMVTSPLTA